MDIVEDKARDVVLIDGQPVDGWIDAKCCATCGTRRIYADTYDAFFCAACNVWLEPVCSDEGCGYCRARPERPLPPT